MVDIVVNPVDVNPTGSTIRRTGVAAEAINAGDAVYVDPVTKEVTRAQKDLTAEEASAVGIAINTAEAAGQEVRYAVSGEVDLGAVIGVGQVYIVGAGAGGIAPEADAGTGDFVTVLGVGVSSTNIKMGILQSGVAHA